ncbi:MAG: cytochrome c, partial [Acidobacteria bacterium]|nr:cytochrome c [Acidobacteriota bacterium]
MKKLVLVVSSCLLGLALYSTSPVSGNTVDKTSVNFTKHIAPIFQNRCEECHRAGAIAPMSLVTYEDVRPWAKAIKEKVVSRQMPPFHAAGAIGRYDHDPRLTDQEIATIAKWVDGGAAKGNLKDMPAPKTWKTGWTNGQPDLILTAKKAFTLKA